MIAEIIPEAYDVEGRKVFRPDARRHSGFKPTFPAGRFLSQPLKHWCSDFVDLRRFLSTCRYVSDKEQFGKNDYWQPPEEFEESRKGDCDDFALWTWRQLLHMNYPTRFVIGTSGRYGQGHAWVTFEKDGKSFLLEPLAWLGGLTLPRLSIVRNKPKFSMVWNGKTISYYEHADRKFSVSPSQMAFMVGEWAIYWFAFWLRILPRLGKRIVFKLLRVKPSQGPESAP